MKITRTDQREEIILTKRRPSRGAYSSVTPHQTLEIRSRFGQMTFKNLSGELLFVLVLVPAHTTDELTARRPPEPEPGALPL